jgi:uncharacterized protein YgiM (DUF1202 family)
MFSVMPSANAASTDIKTGVATVTCNVLRLRERNTTASKTLDYAEKGEIVVVLGKSGNWYHVIYNQREGYMHKNYLKFYQTRNVELGYGEVCGDVVNMRSGSSTKHTIIDQLKYGDRVYIVGIENKWYKIIANDKIGYMRSDYINLLEIPYENEDSKSTPLFFKNGKLIVEKVDPALLNPTVNDENKQPAAPEPNSPPATEPTEPTEPDIMHPVEPPTTEPAEPEKPQDPTEPTTPAEPEPTVPSEPEKPVDPEQPEIPETPEEPEEPKAPEKVFGTVKVTSYLRIRREPSLSSKIVGKLYNGSRVQILETTTVAGMVWGKIDNGWISMDYVIIDQSNDEKPYDEELSKKIVEIAQSCLGVKYVWGGTTMKGFDCSGLTYYVVRQAGFNMPRSMSKQYNSGIPVNKDELKPGDIVFFQNTYKNGMSHMGIYVGDGQFIHAPSTGKTVSYANLNGSYWIEHYYGAVRIIGD